MAMTVGTLEVALKADLRDLKDGLREASSEIRNVERSIDPAVKGSQRLLVGVLGLAAGFGAASIKGIALGGSMEQTKIAFTTMLGSAEAADEMVRGLWDFAARTPFEFAGLTEATRRLLAYGFAAEDIIPTMTAIGDAVSALGGGAAEIDRVTLAIGQMQAKGKVSGEEMRQLAELGIPAWEMLADAIGVSIPEAMKMAEKGAIDAQTGISAILSGMEARFKGSMDVQSQTLLGLWSTAKDNVSGVLRSLGEELVETFDLKTKLAGAIEWLGGFQEALGEGGLKGAFEATFGEGTRIAIMSIAGAITAALVPSLIAAAKAAWALMAPLWPFLLIGAAIGGLGYLLSRAPKGDPAAQAARLEQAQKRVTDVARQGAEQAEVLNLASGDLARTQEALGVQFKDTAPAVETMNSLIVEVKNSIEGLKPSFEGLIPPLDGLRTGFGDVADELAIVDARWKLWAATFTGTEGDPEYQAARVTHLAERMEVLKDAIGEVSAMKGKDAAQTRELELRLLELRTELAETTKEYLAAKEALAGPSPETSRLMLYLGEQAGKAGTTVVERFQWAVSEYLRRMGWAVTPENLAKAKAALNIPGLQSGGIVTRPTLALVGEAGPEAVVPLSRPAPLGPVSITLNITAPSGKADDIAAVVQRVLREDLPRMFRQERLATA